jgi:hypothetical protein
MVSNLRTCRESLRFRMMLSLVPGKRSPGLALYFQGAHSGIFWPWPSSLDKESGAQKMWSLLLHHPLHTWDLSIPSTNDPKHASGAMRALSWSVFLWTVYSTVGALLGPRGGCLSGLFMEFGHTCQLSMCICTMLHTSHQGAGRV